MGAPEEIRQYLVDQGVVLTGVAFARTLPPDPDDVITVLPTGGPEPERMMGGERVLRPTYQVLIRNTDKDTGAALAQTIWDTLENVGETNLTGADGNGNSTTARYLLIQAAQSEPVPLAPDKSDRFIFVVNLNVHKGASA